jgi:hypothetical protein
MNNPPLDPSIAGKRKASMDDDALERPIKHRSSKACQACRTRKVRCDVTTNGSCCTNCRLDQLECVVLPSRRGKNNHTNRRIISTIPEARYLPPTSIQSVKNVTSNPQSHASQSPGQSVPQIQRIELKEAPIRVPVSVTFDDDSDNAGSEQQHVTDDTGRNATNTVGPEPYEGLLTPETGPNGAKDPESPNLKVQLPAFIAPVSTRILGEDLDFLIAKGALTTPEPDLCLEILRGYLFSVHPFMPMLDFRKFIKSITSNGQDGRISLLLFQAVMFAGLHSLPLNVIDRLGFQSAKEARGIFFNRVRLLYEFDIESDSASVLQSLVLMSSWYSKSDARRHTWHWTGLAWDVTRRIGLQREPMSRHISGEVRHFRRRLWWSLYIRDRLITLGTRCPMRIRDDEYNVTMLTLEDFDIEPLDEAHQGTPLAPSATERESVALMCIQLAKLCITIGKVVSSQYGTLTSQPDVPYTTMILSRRDEGCIKQLDTRAKELEEWSQDFAAHIHPPQSKTGHTDYHSCSAVHWAVLNMTHLTTVNVLHRAQALQPLSESAELQAVQKSSRTKVKDAARGLTKALQCMLQHDQVRYLGLIGVTALVAACLTHILDIGSEDEDVRDASTFRLHQSLEVLQSLRDIYGSADAAVSFIASVIRKAGVPLPAHILQFTPTTLQKRTSTSNDTQSRASHGWNLQGNPNWLQTVSNPETTSPNTVSTSRLHAPNSADAMPSSAISGQGIMQPENILMGGPQSANLEAGILDWNGAWENGIDFEPTSFNYDFCFGFLDSDLPGMQVQA